jgi:HSP20 family protein
MAGPDTLSLLDPTKPSVDVIERPDEIVVRAALPGVKKDEIEISVSGTLLTLPAEVDESKAKATLAEGVLELTLPKPLKATRRRIRVD